ncbi:MAG TPA: Rv2175c family DNA-binding protein [Jatrophihabitantaceae bacterium]|nr:Rv2175c family DNA-binding protein [Jatrophihabitantaceae bacterium]
MPEEAPELELIALPEAAQVLGVPPKRISQWIRDGVLLAVRDVQGERCVPAAFIQQGSVVKGLPGVVTLLRDGGYQDDEIVTWLFRADESLPGTPIQALRDNRGTEVKRRAQVAGY